MDSRIYVETVQRNGRTQLNDVYFTVPYKIMQPFYDGEHSDIMIMAASAGLLGGDSLYAEYIFRENSDIKIINQCYEKVMNTLDGYASKDIKITAEKGSVVKFMPYPIIPFKNSDFRSSTEMDVNRQAKIMYCDIFSCGRTGMNNERFQMKLFSSHLKCRVGGRLVFIDNTRISPCDFTYNAMGMWGKYSHNGLAYVYTYEKESEFIAFARDKSKEYIGCKIGLSKCIEGVAVRILADSGDEINSFFSDLSKVL